MAAPKRNQFAKKDEVLDGLLHLRCRREEKGWWKRASERDGFPNLASWVRHRLNADAGKGSD